MVYTLIPEEVVFIIILKNVFMMKFVEEAWHQHLLTLYSIGYF